jgi:DNA polymerase V
MARVLPATATKCFALVDANNFYVSCERVFDPTLEGRPVVVLSNNDGCAIARSNESKSCGIAMGMPIKDLLPIAKKIGLQMRSSNYALYADMSRRIIDVLGQFTPSIENYSIDESFLDLSDVEPADRLQLAAEIRARVLQWTGIPCCVGIGPTKTLAKLANWAAKKRSAAGVWDLTSAAARDELLPTVGVEEVWGVGPAAVTRLQLQSIFTVDQLRRADPRQIRQLLTVLGEKVMRELAGEVCLPLDELPAQRKGTAVTRSFGKPINTWPEMNQALVYYATRAAEKLRSQGLATDRLLVFMETNRFKPNEPQFFPSTKLRLLQPTNDTSILIQAAVAAGERIWREGYAFKKAGIILDDLVLASGAARSLFSESDPALERRAALLAAVDEVNRRHGRGAIAPLGAGVKADWAMRRERLSPCWTTRWSDLPQIG